MIQLTLTNKSIDEITAQLALVTTFEDVRPLKGSAALVDWRLNGKLSDFFIHRKMKGSKGEALLMPLRGRLDSSELLVLGMGVKSSLQDSETPQIINAIVERLMMKKSRSFCLSLSDLIPGMFEWRNAVRLFISMISGRGEEMDVTLVEDRSYIEDAKKRHMDFAFDVQVKYELDG